MTLELFSKRFNAARRAVDTEGRLTTEFSQLLDDLFRSIDTNATTANEDITAAAESGGDNAGTYWGFNPSSAKVWNSDTAGVYEAGDPVQVIVATLFDKDGAQLASVTVSGQLTTVTGNITGSTGLLLGLPATVVYSPATNADPSIKATITVTHPDSTVSVTDVSWSSVDVTAAGGTPVSGISK